MESNSIIQVKNVCKLYGLNRNEASKMMREGHEKDEVFKKTGVVVALWDVSFSVRKGEIFAIIGLSGSGKSTIIRCLNMLNKPTSGTVVFDGHEIETLSKKELLDFRRNKLSMVFQSFGLMSHRSVWENVAYGLEIKGVPKEERERKANEMLDLVGLGGLGDQAIGNLSGGMKQRVGIARALANDPKVLLMDEPFSALDPLVRQDMQFELLSIQRKLGNTIIFITHDINEAFKLGDTVAIMRDGKIIQIDTPEHMSAAPANDYVKKFIDSADKTKILSAKHVMVTPNIVRLKDTPAHAINQMKASEVSSSYVVNEKMAFMGIITIDDAVKAKNEGRALADILRTDVQTTSPDTLVNDILPLAAEAKFPIAVVDQDQVLKGIVSKASVLSSLI